MTHNRMMQLLWQIILITCCLAPSKSLAPPWTLRSSYSRLTRRSVSISKTSHSPPQHRPSTLALSSSSSSSQLVASELPDSLDDAATRAAVASVNFYEAHGAAVRCRVDFDTTIGDETYTLLKASTEFMQKFVAALCYAVLPGVMDARQREIQRVVAARAELRGLEQEEEQQQQQQLASDSNAAAPPTVSRDEEQSQQQQQAREARRDELLEILRRDGRDDSSWSGPVARVYFPDEGSAALARRDWTTKVPSCVQFASCGGVQRHSVQRDELVFLFCPKASEAGFVESTLLRTETEATQLRLIVLVNPKLVDMGVTGFGMAGRLLRERLLDPLQHTYYLRTLAWGALTRQWPNAYSVWREDNDADGGYQLIRTLDRLPSNPEVEDILDEEMGGGPPKGLGVLDQLGDFVQGMMRL